MSNKDFRFKRFSIKQSDTAMKVSTDAILLGAWCRVSRDMQTALDIGAGTGVLSLMVAQRGEEWGLEVDGVEIDTKSALQAKGNVDDSPWSDNVALYNMSIQSFLSQQRTASNGRKYDLIISNPPYFSDPLLSPDSARSAARHTTRLSLDDLAQVASQLLREEGVFALILPFETTELFVETADRHSLFNSRRTIVHTTPESDPKRVLLEFMLKNKGELGLDGESQTTQISYLTIRDSVAGFNSEYKELTKAFYLNF